MYCKNKFLLVIPEFFIPLKFDKIIHLEISREICIYAINVIIFVQTSTNRTNFIASLTEITMSIPALLVNATNLRTESVTPGFEFILKMNLN